MSVSQILNKNGKISTQYLDTTEPPFTGFVTNPLTSSLDCAAYSIASASVLNGVALETESLNLLPGSGASAIAVNDTLAVATSKSLQFDSTPGINSALITHDGTGLQFSGGGLLITKFDSEVQAQGNITSAPLLGGSAVLAGGLSEVQIGGTLAQPPKVRFQVDSQPDGVIEYTGATFTFNPPLTDSDFQTLSILGDQLSISGGNTVTLPTAAPGGASQDIQYNNGSGGFGGGDFTYNPTQRIVRLNQVNEDSRIEVFDTTNGDKSEVKSGQLVCVSQGNEVIVMDAQQTNSSVLVRRANNTANSTVAPSAISTTEPGVSQALLVPGSVVLSDFATGAQSRMDAVGTPMCRVASATLATEQYVSSLDFKEGGVLKAGLAYASGSGAVGLTSANSGEVFLQRTDGVNEESVFALQSSNAYSFGNGDTASDCVLQMTKGGATATITYDGSAFAFNPALPVPPATAPAGADTEIQFNDAGAFGASSNLTFSAGVLGVVGAVDISGASAQLNMSDLSGNAFTVALDAPLQPTVTFIGQGAASMSMTPAGVAYSYGSNVVTADAVTPFVQVSDGADTSALHPGYATASLAPVANDQLTRKDYVDAQVALVSGATPFVIYCVATAAPGGDGSFATPYNSIADAITAAVSGSLIYLSGTFTMVQTTINKSNFTLKALGQAVIQYSAGAIPTTPFRGFWSLTSGTSNVVFDGITFSTTIQPAAELNLLTVLGSNHVVRNCVFAGPASYDAFNPGAITTRGLQMAAGVVNALVEDCDIYNLRQPIYTNNGSGSFLRNSITNTRGAVNSTTGNYYQYTANRFGQNVLDIVILSGVQTGAPYADLYQLSADNNYAVVQDQRSAPTITLQASLPTNVSYNTTFALGSIAQPYYTYFLNSGMGASIALPSTTNANGQYISFNNVPQLPSAGSLTITSSSANIYDKSDGLLKSSLVLAAGQQIKLVYSSAASAWLPFI